MTVGGIGPGARAGFWIVLAGVVGLTFLLGAAVVPGVLPIHAAVALLGGVMVGWWATPERLEQSGPWRAPPFLTAVPLAVAAWAAREPLTEWAGTPWVVALAAAAGVRGLAEVTIATAVVGAFLAPDAGILYWYALPALAGGLVDHTLLRPLVDRLHDRARSAAWSGAIRRARVLILLIVPIALLQRGAERAAAVHNVGVIFALTGRPAKALWLDRWAIRLARRRGLFTLESTVLAGFAAHLHSTGRFDEALAALARSEQLRLDPPSVESALLEGRIRRDAGDLDGALAVADRTPNQVGGIFSGPTPGELADILVFKGMLVGSLLHDEEAALPILERARTVAAGAGDRNREFLATYNVATMQVRLRRYGEAETTLRCALDLSEFADLRARVIARGGMANLYRLQDRLGEAEDWYARAVAVAPGRPLTIGAGIGAALLRLERGDVATARRDLDEIVSRVDELGAEAFVRSAHVAAGKAYERDGDIADLLRAHGHYRTAVAYLERSRAGLTGEDERIQFLGGEPRVEVYERLVATCVALDRPGEAFDVAERAKARALAERLGAGEEPIGHDVLRDVLAAAERPVLFVHYLTTADRVLVLGFRADWPEPRAVSVRTDRDALRRFTLANFGSANQVRDLVREGLSELWHDLDSLVEPVTRWSRPDDLVVLAPHGLLHYCRCTPCGPAERT